MNRRAFIESGVGLVAALPCMKQLMKAEQPAAIMPLAHPSADQVAWQDLEIGMMATLAPNTWQDKEGDDHTTPLSAMNPDIDTDNWAACAAAMGARYIVLVAKHQGGFCLWQTETTNYSIGHTPWKGGHGDVLKDLSASCRKYDLKLGVYVSPRDDQFGAGVGGRCRNPEQQEVYTRIYRTQLREVLSRYGEMMEVWFDGSIVVPTADIVHELAPHAMVFQGPGATIRWVGNENGFGPYPYWNAVSSADAKTGTATAIHSDPHGDVWLPIEADVSSRRPYWFWSTKNERNLMSLEQFLEVYYRTVGRGVQLLISVPPDRTGYMPEADFARVREFGNEVRRKFGNSVAETSGRGRSLVLPLHGKPPVDHVLLQEDCRLGQRVTSYQIEGRAGGQWVPLADGSTIGHKRIQPFDARKVDAVRLLISGTMGEPQIRRFAAFATGSVAPRGWNDGAKFWAANAVGDWARFQFRINLSREMTAAAQYRLRFVPQAGTVTTIRDAELLLQGISEPQLVRLQPGSPNELIVTLTAIGQTVVVQGKIDGAESGTILLQRM